MAENRKDKKREQYHPPLIVFILISLIVITIQIMGGILIYYSITNWGDRANFGEMFGAIGTLFSGLAFAGVIYTILLQRNEFKRTAEAQKQSEQSLTDQANALKETARLNALNFFPAINCKIKDVDPKAQFVIQNPSNIPAFDIDVWVIGIYSEEDLDIPTFFKKYVTQKENKDPADWITPTEEGFYGVYERLTFPIFPQKQQNNSQLQFPQKPGSILAFVQFRDIKGTNYHQVYWFFSESIEDEQRIYRLGSISPVVPCESNRMKFSLKIEVDITGTSPEYFTNFASFWNSSFPSGFLSLKEFRGVEDRGEWETL